MLWVVGLFPWPVLEFVFMSKDGPRRFFGDFEGFVGPCTVDIISPPVGS